MYKSIESPLKRRARMHLSHTAHPSLSHCLWLLYGSMVLEMADGTLIHLGLEVSLRAASLRINCIVSGGRDGEAKERRQFGNISLVRVSKEIGFLESE